MRLRRPRVTKVAPGLRHERGPAFDDRAPRIAVVAHYSDRARISRSVQELLTELAKGGYTSALVSTAETPGPLQPCEGHSEIPATVFRRPNLGYDFGSWAAFLNAYPLTRSAPRVLLANDSLVGPFETMTPILAGFDGCTSDIWGVTGSTQDAPHLQSYMIGYTDGVLETRALRQFWDGVRVQPTKRQLILSYEIGLGRLARKTGLSTSAHFPWRQVTTMGQNPTSVGWRRLIMSGFPFVKRELVTHPPPEVPDAADVASVVRETWGQNVYEWV